MRSTVVLERDGSRLLEATLAAPNVVSQAGPTLTLDATRAGLASHAERYVSLPDSPPALLLLSALDNIESAGYASPTTASRIEAVLVSPEWLNRPPRPVWAVTLSGLAPWPVQAPGGLPTPDVPTWKRNHLRHVVDATTGEVLFATTIPQPREP